MVKGRESRSELKCKNLEEREEKAGRAAEMETALQHEGKKSIIKPDDGRAGEPFVQTWPL